MDWCGIVRSGDYSEAEQSLRKEVARTIQAHDWQGLFAILEERPDLTNAVLLDNPDWHAPLHLMVLGAAPAEAIERFVKLGAWRTLRTRGGERAVDIAHRLGHLQLLDLLEPVYRRVVDPGLLAQVQERFHKIIVGRINVISEWESLRLPELEVLLEMEDPSLWFAVPGMYGGFSYTLELVGGRPRQVSNSWSRVVDGSAERHEITPEGVILIEQDPGGFPVVVRRAPKVPPPG